MFLGCIADEYLPLAQFHSIPQPSSAQSNSGGAARADNEVLWCLGEKQDSTGERLERFVGFVPRERIASVRIDDGTFITPAMCNERFAGTYTILMADGKAIEAKDTVLFGDSLQYRDPETGGVALLPVPMIHSMSRRRTVIGLIAGLAAGHVAGWSGPIIGTVFGWSGGGHSGSFASWVYPLAITTMVVGPIIGAVVGIENAPRTEFRFDRVDDP